MSARPTKLATALATVLPTAVAFTAVAARAQEPAATPRPLATAEQLARTTFRGFTYGSWNLKRKTLDCVVYVDAVVRELARRSGREYADETSRVLKIAHLSEKQLEALQQLVAEGDPAIRGVQTALVAAGLGETVDPGDARPGDFVQYWYRTGSGRWAGHAGIVQAIDEKGVATILGSHKSTLRVRADGNTKIPVSKGGIGAGPRFVLSDPKRKVFVVRWKPRAESDGEAPDRKASDGEAREGARTKTPDQLDAQHAR